MLSAGFFVTLQNKFGNGISFIHGKGATNGWLFFAHLPGSDQRHIVKVWGTSVRGLEFVVWVRVGVSGWVEV